MDKDITDQVEFGEIDGEFLELKGCACGCYRQVDLWEIFLGISRDTAFKCPHCGRKLYFTNKITVFEVVEKQGGE